MLMSSVMWALVKKTSHAGMLPLMHLFIRSSMVFGWIGPRLEVLSNWIATILSPVGYRFLIVTRVRLFRLRLFGTMVNFLSSLSLRNVNFSVPICPQVLGVISIITIRRRL